MNTSEQMNDMPVMSRVDAKEKGAERGKALRKQVPRKSHAAWTPPVDRGDPLVLQVKEAQESVLERFLGRSKYEQHGKRVVMGQCAMQTASDILLGWTSAPVLGSDDKEYYVRQLWDGKGSFDLSMLDADKLAMYARECGWILAHAHARAGDRFAIAGYLGTSDTFDKAIAKFAVAYADQNELDYQRFLEARKAGEL